MLRSSGLEQLARYLIVGGICTIIDISGFIGLRALGLSIISASALAFCLGTTVNYFLSYLIAFRRGRFDRASEFTRLVAVAVVGLGLNTLAVYSLSAAGLPEVAAKTLAVPCVLAWNFLGRRWLVFHPELPAPRLGVGVGGGDSAVIGSLQANRTAGCAQEGLLSPRLTRGKDLVEDLGEVEIIRR